MKISNKIIKTLIKESLKEHILKEQNLDYLSPLKYFFGNDNLKAFKVEVFERLKPIYEKNPSAEFLGTMSREVVRVIKQLYNDPNSEFVDRNFLQNDIRKFHYLPVDDLDEFLLTAESNKKNEISAVGYIDKDTFHTAAGGRGSMVAVEIEGYVTLAGNLNMSTGQKPTQQELENFPNSGVPKDFYMDPGTSLPTNKIVLFQTLLLHTYKLTNMINFVLDSIILDRSTFKTAEKRMSFLNIGGTRWNEIVLDNWKPKAIILGPNTFMRKQRGKHATAAKEIRDRIFAIAKKHNLPVLDPLGHHEFNLSALAPRK